MGENDSFRIIPKDAASTFLVGLAFVAFVFFTHEVRAGDFYAGAGIGRAHMALTPCPNGFDCQNREQGWKAFLGYQVNRYFSMEAEWIDLGQSTRISLPTASAFELHRKGTLSTATARGPAIAALGFLPLGERFSLYAGAGLHALTVRNQVLGRPDQDHSIFQVNTSGTSLGSVFSFGAQVALTNHVFARAEYSHLHRVGGSTIGGLTEKELFVGSLFYSFR